MNVHYTGIWKAASAVVALTMLVLIGLPVAPARVAFAANTGWRNPAANAADTGGNGDGFERTTTNAYANSPTTPGYAESRNTCITAPCTERHRFYNYGFNIPADAVIQGIEVRADWWVNATDGNDTLGVDLSWDGGTSWTILQTDTTPTTSEEESILGGAGNTWGRTWSPGDFSNANFRVRVNISTNVVDRRFYLDWIPVRITYNQSPNIPTNQTPAGGTFTAAANPTFAWSAFSDPNPADTQIAFQVQVRTQTGGYGGLGSRDSASVASPANTYTPVAWNLEPATYCWHVRVQDNSGVANAWSDYSSETCFTVDRAAPTSAATSPGYDNGGAIPVSWTASDDAGGSGVATVALWYRLDAGAWTSSGMSQSGTAGTFNFAPPGGTEGTYYFQTVATDAVGNVEAGPAGDGDDSTVYDTTAPTSQAAPPAGPVDAAPISVPWTADGAISGIATGGILLRYNHDGGAYADGPTASGTSGTFNFVPPNGAGTYCFYTIATDNAGNVETPPGGANGDGCTVSNAPSAVDDSYSTLQNTPLSVAAPGVLANDVDALTAALVSGPTSGTLNLEADGSFLYTPAAGFSGQVTFTYRAVAGTATSDVATVTITVTPISGAPVAVDDSYSTAEDTPLNVAAPGVLANDVDALTAVEVAGPASGTLALQTNGSFVYTPAANYHGTVTFTYQASNSMGSSNVATVTITVTPVNDAPVAVDDSYSTAQDTPLAVIAPGVLANDTDADGDTLTAVEVAGPASGTLALQADGSFVYTPASGFEGAVTFTYRASDGTATSNVATVAITVNAEEMHDLYLPVVLRNY